uniref:Uncharacterized protein n=1 Tax=Oryza glumipatula TaxID=40148 RepID=A0A0D9ZHN9_9ORYZ
MLSGFECDEADEYSGVGTRKRSFLRPPRPTHTRSGGSRRRHEAIRLRRWHRIVEHRTTPSLPGYPSPKVKCLVAAETEEMHAARGRAEEQRPAP